MSASKSEVHQAIQNMDKGLFPSAFCKIIPDFVGGDTQYCNIMHADTAGTKTSLAYMYWKETGDISVWKGIVEDAIVMNLDDMACVGCIDNIIFSSTIGRNRHLVSGEVISTLINHANHFADKLKTLGVNIHLSGGETADVGDIVRTADVGYTAFARMKREDVIDPDIKAGAVIVGLASYGQASYETSYNGGMGSNGLTSARHDVFAPIYRDKYPECYDPSTDRNYIFCGSKKLTDTIMIDGEEMPIGKLVLSPTRTYLPVIKGVLAKHGDSIQGMIHNTGGAHTKVLKFCKNPVKIIKDSMPELPPLFRLIKEESGVDMREMYQVFNCGIRLEFYVENSSVVEEIMQISKSFNIDAFIIGRVEESEKLELDVMGNRY
ncbi:MAG TPA: AIR synthase-related protein [Saprospiraceae bacterium]|nr:AIR synthase-related protein [Saprospiraceae bacterium]